MWFHSSLSQPIQVGTAAALPSLWDYFCTASYCQLNFLNQLIAGSDKCLDRHIEGRIKLGGLQPHSLD